MFSTAHRLHHLYCVLSVLTLCACLYIHPPLPPQHYDAFLELCKKKLTQFYGQDVQKNADFGRIVSPMHCERLKVRC